MDSIGTPNHWDRGLTIWKRFNRGVVQLVSQAQPFGRRRKLIAIGPAIPTIKIAAKAIALHILGRERIDLRLDQLRDFTLKRHARDDIGNLRLAIQLLRRN